MSHRSIESIPNARRTDPATSYSAGRGITATGERQRQADAILDVVRNNPGRTSAELAILMPYDRYQVARRLPDLRELGLVYQNGARRCEVSGRMAVLWWPASPEPKQVPLL